MGINQIRLTVKILPVVVALLLAALTYEFSSLNAASQHMEAIHQRQVKS